MRERWIDAWKGLLIFLVVLGHVAGVLEHLTHGAANISAAFMYKWIYLFHMPAFFFLSGYVRGSRSNGCAPFVEFFFKKIRRLAVPYFIWGFVSMVVYHFFAEAFNRSLAGGNDGYYKASMFANDMGRMLLSLIHAGGWPNGDAFRSNSVLWFLPCIFTTSVVYEMAFRRFSSMGNRLRISFLSILAVAGFAIGGVMRLYVRLVLPWGIASLPWWLAFMSLGGMFAEFGTMRRSSMSMRVIIAVIGIMLFTAVTAILPDMIWAHRRWGGYMTAVVMAAGGCVLSLIVASFWGRSSSGKEMSSLWGNLWCRLGVVSMGIMLIHKFPLLGMQYAFARWKLFAFIDSGILAFAASVMIAVCVSGVSYMAVLFVRRIAPFSFGEHGRNS